MLNLSEACKIYMTCCFCGNIEFLTPYVMITGLAAPDNYILQTTCSYSVSRCCCQSGGTIVEVVPLIITTCILHVVHFVCGISFNSCANIPTVSTKSMHGALNLWFTNLIFDCIFCQLV